MSIHLLIIEDNQDHICIIERSLSVKHNEYKLDFAAGVDEGLAKLQKDKFDMILCDYFLPGRNALDMLHEICAREIDLPFIVMTSSANVKAAVELLNTGAYDYIVKDEQFDTSLPIVIHRALERYFQKNTKEQAVQVIKESELKYKNLIANIPGMVYSSYNDWTAGFLSGSEQICGYSQEMLNQPGSTWQDIIHPDDKQRVINESAEKINSKKSFIQTYRIMHKDGSIHWIEDHKIGSFSKDGGLAKVEGVVYDITERKKKEQEIVSLSKFPSENPYPTLRIEHDGRLLYANPSSQGLLDNWHINIGGYVPDNWKQLIQEVLDSNKPRVIEIEHNKKVVSFVITPIKDSSYVNLYGRDETDSKITQAKLREKEGELLQSQKLEATSRLSGGIAHEFNNILTVIKGFAGFVKDDLPADSPSIKDMQEILNAADRAKNLTQQLLAFSRKQIIEPKIIDLNDLIVDTHKMLRRLIGADIELVTMPQSELGLVNIDIGCFEQILVNLAINARDAMPEGGTLTISTKNVTIELNENHAYGDLLQGEYVVLSVQDTGMGIPEDIKAHIFEPFFTTKEKGKGTGLGLSTCYGIVKQSKGQIFVESEAGSGSCFNVYVPKVSDDNQKDNFNKQQAEIPLPGGSETVLLVEDEPLVQSMSERVLLKSGYKVVKAQNGEDALRIISSYNEPIHMLLTDVMMPCMGGIELAKRIRTIDPQMKILYMSGYMELPAAGSSSFFKLNEFLQKPFSIDMLCKKVREVLDRIPQ
ncbi:MAG: response regulator [bacterium]